MNRLKQHHKTCEICQCKFWSHRSDAKTCSETCKKRRQRGTQYAYTNKGGWRTFEKLPERKPRLAEVPATDGKTHTPECRPEVPVIQHAWPQGTLVVALNSATGRREPGRVDWFSKAAGPCLKLAAHLKKPSDVNNTYMVPVAFLTITHAVWLWDAERK